MTIECMPRSRRDEDGWRDPKPNPTCPAPLVDVDPETGARSGIRVPVVVDRRWVPRVPQLSPARVFTLVRLGLLAVVLLGYFVTELVRWVTTAWSARLLVAAVLAVVLYRALRLRRWGQHGRRADLVLSPDGIRVGGLAVPWHQIEEVVRFNLLVFLSPRGAGVRNVLAVRVQDFVAVQGLSPFRAGLANLSRRHLLVLAESSELRHPETLARAVEELVANPTSRLLLTGAEGRRLVDEGPPGR